MTSLLIPISGPLIRSESNDRTRINEAARVQITLHQDEGGDAHVLFSLGEPINHRASTVLAHLTGTFVVMNGPVLFEDLLATTANDLIVRFG